MKNFVDTNTKAGAVSGLAILRALAIVGVTLFHVFPQVVKGGYLGVSLFFVLTGFLLAYTCKKSYETGDFSLLQYYKKRILRIYPALLLVVFISLGAFSLVTPKLLDGMHHELLSIFGGYNNWWQIAQNADYFTRLTNSSPFTHLWFLGIELQYYLVWPLIFGVYVCLKKGLGQKAAIGCLGLAALLAAGVMPLMYKPDIDVTRLYYGTDTRLYALLFGAVLGLNYRERTTDEARPEPTLGKKLLLWVSLAVTVAAYACLDGTNPLTYKGGMLAMTLVFCLMLYVLTNCPAVGGSLLENKVFSWLGHRSYGIFLWQYPVLYLFRHLHWTEVQGYALAEIAVILLLATASDFIIDALGKGGLTWRKIASSQGVALLLLCFISVGFMCQGCYGLSQASTKTRKEQQAELQAQLEAKARALELHKQQVAANMKGVVCIGDSVMLQASDALKKLLPDSYIDAKISRYVSGGREVAQQLNREGRLSKVVVISLGTNGFITGEEKYEVQTLGLLKELGEDRHIFWVNVYGEDLVWQTPNNQYIAKLAAERKNITVVDWYSAVSQHKEWLDQDEVHPTEEGSVFYARLIRDTIEKTLMEKK